MGDEYLTRDPHVAIMQAAINGRGVRLSADEVAYLACDAAIETRAANIADGHLNMDTEGFPPDILLPPWAQKLQPDTGK